MKAIFISLLLALATSVPATAQTVPSGMTYQGRLTDASNAPVPDGTGYQLEVRLWNVGAGGPNPILLWGSRYSSVPVKNGAFNLILGIGGESIQGALYADLKTAFTTNPSVHLGLKMTKRADGTDVNGSEILPRQQIFSTPYAFRAESAASVQPDGVLSAAIKDGEVKTADIADGAVTNAKLAQNSVNLSNVLANSLNSSAIAAAGISMDRIALEYAFFVDEKPVGTDGGSAIAGWQTRTLNTTRSLTGGSISRNGNAITLAPGTYFIDASVPSYAANRHLAILRDLSNNSTLMTGTSENSDTSGNNSPSRSQVKGYLATATGVTFDIYHYTRSGNSNIGLGIGTQFSAGQRTEPSVFTTINIQRIK